jgi:hypothetical protein
MVIGNCHLCGQRDELRDSHVWPRFAYKQFVSDLSKGGSFLDLMQQRITNAQYKRSWLCSVCESRFGDWETHAAELCQQIEAQPSAPQRYDERLLPFATSISWRTAKFSTEVGGPSHFSRSVKVPLRQWKDYLRGKKSGIGPFSQHLFVIVGGDIDWHKALGGEVHYREQVVLSQIGPLFILGLLEANHLTEAERRIWDHSRIAIEGGEVSRVLAWRVGTELTISLARLLAAHEHATKQRIWNLAKQSE